MTYKSYKQRLNIKLGLDEDTEHTLKQLKNITGIPIKILKEVKKRGKGAYNTNLGSVRLKEDYSKNDDLRKGASKDYHHSNGQKREFTRLFIRVYFRVCDTRNKTWIYMI